MMSTGFDDSVPFDAFTMDDVDADAPGSRGGGKLPEGGYLFQITEVVIKNERGSTQIECEVLLAKDAALIGRKHFEYMPWPDNQHTPDYNRIKKEQLLAWCYAAKTTSPEEIKARQQAGQGFDPAWLGAMVGHKVLGFVKAETYQGNDGSEKSSVKCEGRVWALDNPKGKGLPGWEGGATPEPTPPVTPAPTTTATASAASDPFGGLV